jgi:hypothetical protein
MTKTTFSILFPGLLCFACCGLPVLMAQTTSQTSFGKNRVQYNRQIDEWMLYESSNFVTYWYGDARNIAQATLQTAEYDFPYVQQLLEHQLTEKVEMLVFSDLTDLKQSNIGEDEVFQLRAGETKVVGNKVFVYFDGDHNHLRAQMREGVAGVLINSMLFGTNLQEIVQNAVLLNLPGWYTNGLMAYCGEEWSTDLDNHLRDLVQSGKYKNFDKLAKDHPRLAGHAFWNYIGLHFGRSTVSNLLYLTRINRSTDAGFLYVLGSGYRRTTDAMLDYYRKRYRDEAKSTKTPDQAGQIVIKNKKKLPLYQVRVSPDGRRIAWVSNDIGKWRVWVMDLETGKRKRVLKGGARNALQATDYGYPQIAWNPDNQRLAVLYERRDIPRIALLDLAKGKKEISDLSPEYQRVFSMDYVTPVDIVLSAAVKGFSDLFIYHTVTRQTERITQDFWDDLDASVATIDGHKGILFASNRATDTLSIEKLDTVLPLNRFDVFFYDLDSRSAELVRITNTPMFDERHPVGVDSAHFTFLSDENGISNRQTGYLEPYIAYHQAVVYLHDGAEVKALDTAKPGEWPFERVLAFLAPLDTVLQNVDSAQIDSIRFSPVYKKRARTWNQTNADRNITEHHIAVRTGRLVEAIPRDGKTLFYTRTINPQAVASTRFTRYRELTFRNAGLAIPAQPAIDSDQGQAPDKQPDASDLARPDTVIQIEPGWLFQLPDYLAAPPPENAPEAKAPPEKEEEEEPKTNEDIGIVLMQPAPRRPLKPTKPFMELGKSNAVIRFNPSQIIPYRLKFRTDYISTSIDNNLLFEGLNSYAGTPDFETPPPGILLKANFKDLLENYVLEAGFRLPTTFNGAEYYLWFDDKKHRIDKRYALYRKTVVNSLNQPIPGTPLNEPPQQLRTNTLLGQFEMRYPLDVFFSLRGTATIRQDKSILLSTSRTSLEVPDYAEQRASLRLAAVYDNTVDVDLNLKTGSRARLFVEVVKRFDFNTQPNWSLRFNKGIMTVIGLDARHYQLLDRRSILAVRLAAATTFGSEKILYFLGGVDNWIFPKFNNDIPLPQGNDFAYQTLAANLRGFDQNIRNGNSFALINTELRVPLFKYFSNKPVMGNFWRNFQVIGFFDVGTAWQGQDPYGGDNPINIVYLYNPPIVSVKVNYFRDPLVAGYGFGARALIFGMYIRADYAWGIETRVVQKPIFHLALGTDF